jgi:hypothetical protein
MLPASAAAVMTGTYPRVFKFFNTWKSFSHKHNDVQLHTVETILRYQLW